MVLRILYPNLIYDYISTQMLDNLIASRKIIQFYRPSEGRWVDIDRDANALRQAGNRRYDGIERRTAILARM